MVPTTTHHIHRSILRVIRVVHKITPRATLIQHQGLIRKYFGLGCYYSGCSVIHRAHAIIGQVRMETTTGIVSVVETPNLIWTVNRHYHYSNSYTRPTPSYTTTSNYTSSYQPQSYTSSSYRPSTYSSSLYNNTSNYGSNSTYSSRSSSSSTLRDYSTRSSSKDYSSYRRYNY